MQFPREVRKTANPPSLPPVSRPGRCFDSQLSGTSPGNACLLFKSKPPTALSPARCDVRQHLPSPFRRSSPGPCFLHKAWGHVVVQNHRWVESSYLRPRCGPSPDHHPCRRPPKGLCFLPANSFPSGGKRAEGISLQQALLSAPEHGFHTPLDGWVDASVPPPPQGCTAPAGQVTEGSPCPSPELVPQVPPTLSNHLWGYRA